MVGGEGGADSGDIRRAGYEVTLVSTGDIDSLVLVVGLFNVKECARSQNSNDLLVQILFFNGKKKRC